MTVQEEAARRQLAALVEDTTIYQAYSAWFHAYIREPLSGAEVEVMREGFWAGYLAALNRVAGNEHLPGMY